MVYQPVIDAPSGTLVGAEALIRWDRPGIGLLPPDSFIPIAESTGLIIALDRWVLGAVTRQMASWAARGELPGLNVAVNISGRHLVSGQLPGDLRAALHASGVDPHRLSVEVTETVLLADLTVAATELHAVRALGVSVAIDDYGTGFTSLAHLQQLPVDILKIDRSLVSQMHLTRGRSIVRMVTDLGHALDLQIVAEGVETEDQMAALQSMGADLLQGYFLSRPIEAAALPGWSRPRDQSPLARPLAAPGQGFDLAYSYNG